ncbi:peptide/nickel transport system permease protein [Raineyella antarctica]|uniref:Peptide/nickel transport system permease protein n=1 Tax=Raineyella antarctica TaxID=1577474 RepID=A0A1G6GV65_9ACTN|nr:ABC transporter permease [Raineyella antarctica]SDB85834.1 peptide/nickel transport system permease protein [Raineyella antarctica]
MPPRVPLSVPLRLLQRLGVFVASVVVASLLVFLVASALPGNVAQVVLGVQATPEAVARLEQEFGLDRPWPVRYGAWFAGLLRFDLGRSYLTGQPVLDQVLPRLGVTSWLVGLAMVLALLVAVPLGMWAAVRRRHADGFLASALSQVGLAVPSFWLGILASLVFAVQLGWFPANGYVPLSAGFGPWARHLVLPVVALSAVQSAVLARYVRSATVEVLHEDYYRTARAGGWRTVQALLRHGLRNMSLSVVTVVGLQLATLLAGAIIIESVFALPGLGRLLLDAVAQRDLMVVQGVVLLLVVAVLAINALVDMSYALLDPRLRIERGQVR